MNTLSELYKTDFHAWALKTAELIRQRRFNELNLEELAEEIEDLGDKERNEVENCLVILLAHLLKWQFQKQQLTDRWLEFKANSWRSSINEQRTQILRQFKFSPSVKSYIPSAVDGAYPDAVELAAEDSGLPQHLFPVHCPYTIEQILDKAFYPES